MNPPDYQNLFAQLKLESTSAKHEQFTVKDLYDYSTKTFLGKIWFSLKLVAYEHKEWLSANRFDHILKNKHNQDILIRAYNCGITAIGNVAADLSKDNSQLKLWTFCELIVNSDSELKKKTLENSFLIKTSKTTPENLCLALNIKKEIEDIEGKRQEIKERREIILKKALDSDTYSGKFNKKEVNFKSLDEIKAHCRLFLETTAEQTTTQAALTEQQTGIDKALAFFFEKNDNADSQLLLQEINSSYIAPDKGAYAEIGIFNPDIPCLRAHSIIIEKQQLNASVLSYPLGDDNNLTYVASSSLRQIVSSDSGSDSGSDSESEEVQKEEVQKEDDAFYFWKAVMGFSQKEDLAFSPVMIVNLNDNDSGSSYLPEENDNEDNQESDSPFVRSADSNDPRQPVQNFTLQSGKIEPIAISVYTPPKKDLASMVQLIEANADKKIWIHCDDGFTDTSELVVALILKKLILNKTITRQNLADKIKEIVIDLRNQRGSKFIENASSLSNLLTFGQSFLEPVKSSFDISFEEINAVNASHPNEVFFRHSLVKNGLIATVQINDESRDIFFEKTADNHYKLTTLVDSEEEPTFLFVSQIKQFVLDIKEEAEKIKKNQSLLTKKINQSKDWGFGFSNDADIHFSWEGLKKKTLDIPFDESLFLTIKEVTSSFPNISTPRATAVTINTHFLPANYVGVAENNKRFIAMQAPSTSYRKDMWALAFEQDRTIFDLTSLVDINEEKVKAYYPISKEEPLITGGITITLTDQDKLDKDFTIENRDSPYIQKNVYQVIKGGIAKKITRYHYKTWIDQTKLSVDRLDKIVDLMAQPVEQFDELGNLIKPVEQFDESGNLMTKLIELIVHCKAGVGRTGTAITAYLLKQQINSDKTWNKNNLLEKLSELIFELRQQRSEQFVQTEDQFTSLVQYGEFLINKRDNISSN